MLGLRLQNLCASVYRKNIVSLTLSSHHLARRILVQNARYFSENTENVWKDGAIEYSTSKASKHKVNSTIGLDKTRKVTYKPLVFGLLTFTALMYVMFFYNGEKNDVFVTITPESVRDQYIQAVNQTNVLSVTEDEKEDSKDQ